MDRRKTLLICDDDSLFHLAVKHVLKSRYQCLSARDGDEALAIVRKTPVDVLLLDIQIRTQDEGLRYLPRLKEADPDLAIVMSSGMTDFHTVKEAMRLGAADYVPKDFNPDDLAHTIEQVLERRSLLQRRAQQDFEAVSVQKRHVLVGESPAIQAIRKTIGKLRSNRLSVIISGETGTGKEVVARQLRGTLPDGSLEPFVAVDSSTIQSSTAESLLFGHEKGAFTGADRTAKGIFEEADGGIVYFDEIGNMPLEIQAKLLRVLQEKEICRLGSSKVVSLEFRVVCATNRDLEAMVRAGQFKGDLLQRLNVAPIVIPPLRERREDIPSLIEHWAGSRGAGKPVRFAPEAIEILQGYDWPGNVRELANVISYVAAMSEGPEIEASDLPPKIRDAARPDAGASSSSEAGRESFYDRVAAFEKEILARAYAEHEGNISRLALHLGMDRSHLYTKLREFGIHLARK